MSYGKSRGLYRLVLSGKPYEFLWNVGVTSFTVNDKFLISPFAMYVCIPLRAGR